MSAILGDSVTGEPIELMGFAARYIAKSAPCNDRWGLPRMFLPGAFQHADFSNAVLNHAHNAFEQMFCDLWLAPTSGGLAFRARNIAATDTAQIILALVAAGEMNGCSWRAVLGGEMRVQVAGEEVAAMHSVGPVLDVCVTASPLIPDAGCWTANQTKLSAHLKVLKMAWDLETDADTPWVRAAGPGA